MGDLDPEALRRALEAAEAEAAQRNINLVTRVRRIIVGPGEDVDKAVAAAKEGRMWTRLLRRRRRTAPTMSLRASSSREIVMSTPRSRAVPIRSLLRLGSHERGVGPGG